MAKALASQGFAVWNLEYRRLDDGGGWPWTFEDVANGTDFLRVLAPLYLLDLSHVIVIGHSAGGHLALWLAARHNLPENSIFYSPQPLSLIGVVSMAGIPDLKNAISKNLCGGAAEVLIGGSTNEFPERYAQGSPHELLPLSIPQIFIEGLQDDLVPLDYVQEYIEDAEKSGDSINLETFDQTGHFELALPTTESGQAIINAVKVLNTKTK